MSPRNWLGALQMREARHREVGAGFRLSKQSVNQLLQFTACRIRLTANPKPEVRRNLIVPAPSGVQFSRRVADNFAKTRLDVHVDVFQRR